MGGLFPFPDCGHDLRCGSSCAGEARILPGGARWVPLGDCPRRCVRVVLAISATGVYLLLALAFLVILGGGTVALYFIERRRRPQRRVGETPTGAEGGDGGAGPSLPD